MEKYKARKVGRGFSQEAGINYDETYAQMMRPETLKILLVIALHRYWAIRQWDVVAAYLQTLLQHDVYITDINEDGETEYWKLNKALYGLKQANHEWFKTLAEILGTLGMYQCIGDEGTYTNITEQATRSSQIIIGTHVDDLVGIAFMEQDLDNAEKAIEQRVELDKRGRPSNMLGMELHWSEEQVVLTQTRLIESMISQQLNGNSSGRHSLHINPEAYQKAEQTENEKPPKYQSLIGSLLFVARMTRPEISVHVNLLGRRTKDATNTHWKTALQVLRYLGSTKSEGLVLRKTPGSLPENIYRRGIWGRGFEIPNGSNNVSWGPADWMVQSATGCGIPICDGIGVHCGLRGCEGCGLGSAVPIRDWDINPTHTKDRKRRGLPPQQNTQIYAPEPPYRASVPLPSPTGTSGETNYPHNTWEGQSGRPPHQGTPHGSSEWMEGAMDAYLATILETMEEELGTWALEQGGV